MYEKNHHNLTKQPWAKTTQAEMTHDQNDCTETTPTGPDDLSERMFKE